MANKTITDLQLQSTPALSDYMPVDDSIQTYRSTWQKIYDLFFPTDGIVSAKLSQAVVQQFCQGRLSLTTAVPVTTADVLAATAVKFVPYQGDKLGLFDGTRWKLYEFTELSIAVPSTTVTMYDVFVYDNSGTLTLEAVAWTNDTTRATALALQDGVYCKSGTLTKRYLGNFRTTGSSGQTEDSFAKRFVWNYYNRVLRPMKVLEATDSWTYSTASFRQANASTANQLDFIIGVSEDMVSAIANALADNSTLTLASCRIGIGLDSTTVSSANFMPDGQFSSTMTHSPIFSYYKGYPGIGRHFLAWLEQGYGSLTQTWYGDGGAPTSFQMGIIGEIRG